MLGFLWILNPDCISEIYNMIIARAVGLKEANAPILPLVALPAVLILAISGGFLIFKFVELPALRILTELF